VRDIQKLTFEEYIREFIEQVGAASTQKNNTSASSSAKNSNGKAKSNQKSNNSGMSPASIGPVSQSEKCWWGGELEISLLSMMLKRDILVYCTRNNTWGEYIFNDGRGAQGEQIFIRRDNERKHYDALIPTVLEKSYEPSVGNSSGNVGSVMKRVQSVQSVDLKLKEQLQSQKSSMIIDVEQNGTSGLNPSSKPRCSRNLFPEPPGPTAMYIHDHEDGEKCLVFSLMPERRKSEVSGEKRNGDGDSEMIQLIQHFTTVMKRMDLIRYSDQDNLNPVFPAPASSTL
jgi:hypothetical protein